jgi:hypothetical protein
MAQAFVIASTTDAETVGDPPRGLWVVLADTPHLAAWSALGSSPISQDVSKIIDILAASFDPLNGASLEGDATTDQAGAANDVAGSVGEAPPIPSHIRQR